MKYIFSLRVDEQLRMFKHVNLDSQHVYLVFFCPLIVTVNFSTDQKPC